jgi:hypothetical protein
VERCLDARADFNGNCIVYISVFSLLRSNFGPGGATAVPPGPLIALVDAAGGTRPGGHGEMRLRSKTQTIPRNDHILLVQEVARAGAPG